MSQKAVLGDLWDGFDFWRIEAQITKVNKDCFGLIDDKTISDFNPFERLDFYDPFAWGRGGYKAFVELARLVGVDKAISLFDHKTRKTHLSKLKQDTIKLSFNLPSDIYKHLFNRVYVRPVNKLFDCFEKGQGLRKSKLMRLRVYCGSCFLLKRCFCVV